MSEAAPTPASGTNSNDRDAAPAWLHAYAGRFIVFDGPDGSGKTTQYKRLSELFTRGGVSVCEVREPGGTMIGERIRDILLDTKSEMSARCEMLLYMASRAQLIEERIRPALDRKCLVLADRFVSSTYAYQGAGAGLPGADIAAVAAAAVQTCWPNLVIIFDVDEETAARRMVGGVPAPTKGKGKNGGAAAAAGGMGLFADRIEQRGPAFRAKVRESYLEQAERDPSRYVVVDARGTPEEVWKLLLEALAARA